MWQLFNLTADTHPIHFHLVNVQIIQRQPFTGDPDAGFQLGGATPPDPNETGWKETVRMNPGEATTVIAQFALPKLPAAMGDPTSPRTGGHEYVWHCHILEHEEHDMMHFGTILASLAAPNPAPTLVTGENIGFAQIANQSREHILWRAKVSPCDPRSSKSFD